MTNPEPFLESNEGLAIFSAAVDQVVHSGAAKISHFLPPGINYDLQEELRWANFTKAIPYNPALVTETYSRLDKSTWSPALESKVDFVAGILDDLVEQVAVTQPNLDEWFINDASIQRYQKGEEISPHRDITADLGLIAILNAQGSGIFSIYEKREGAPIEQWLVEQGDLVLLRGAGLVYDKACPLHSVVNVDEKPRTSIGFRHRADS